MSKDKKVLIGATLVCRGTPVGNHCLRTQGTHEANDEPWIEEKKEERNGYSEAIQGKSLQLSLRVKQSKGNEMITR